MLGLRTSISELINDGACKLYEGSSSLDHGFDLADGHSVDDGWARLRGSAAVALLVLTTIRVPTWAVFYLLVFGLGTVAGMMLITAAIAFPFPYSESRFIWLSRGLG